MAWQQLQLRFGGFGVEDVVLVFSDIGDMPSFIELGFGNCSWAIAFHSGREVASRASSNPRLARLQAKAEPLNSAW